MTSDELVRIDYRLERLLWADPGEDQLDVWEARLQVDGLPDDDGDDVGREVSWCTVARATLFGMDPDRHAAVGEAPFDVADAHSSDAAYYYEHLFRVDGNMLPDVAEAFELASNRALFLHDVRVPEDHRRRGYGRLLAADAILTLAPLGTAVFAHPGPTDPNIGEDADVGRLRRETENTRFLASLGFLPFRDRLWTLDLSAAEGFETLTRLRRRP
ncbi:MAG TPA: hypothetical protein VG452_09140 [Egibacteraceae bacterium]|nr:hypothetical protein [Egibacteraceae bacterium]